MNLKRNFALVLALGALLVISSNCTIIYSGCEDDSECNMEAGERCITTSGGSGECGLPQNYCEEGATMRCEDAAFDPAVLQMSMDTGEEPVARGECAAKQQICGDDGTFQGCIEPEVCDGLDNDCNGSADDGLPGVNEPCSVGDGVCRTEGRTVCSGIDVITCGASAGPRNAAACDCDDNNCDAIVNDFVVSAQPSAGEPVVPQSDWVFTSLGGARYAAVDNGSGGIDVLAMDMDGATIATIAEGASPRIFSSAQGGVLLVFYTADADNELAMPQQEVHRVTIDPALGTVSAPLCLGCADPRRSEKGGVVAYDVDFAGVDGNLDGLDDFDDTGCTGSVCGYVAAYVRELGQVFTARVDALSYDLMPTSEGIVLAFQDGNNNLVDVDIEIANPAGLAYLALTRTVAGVSSITLASVLATNRVQVNTATTVVNNFDPSTQDFDFDVLADTTVVLAVSNPAGVEVTRYAVQNNTNTFEPLFETVSVTPHTAGTVSSPQLSWICNAANNAPQPTPETTFVAFEVVDAAGTSVIEAATIDRNQGLIALHPTQTVTGTRPVLRRLGDDIVVGALVPTSAADGSVTPSVDPLTCDP